MKSSKVFYDVSDEDLNQYFPDLPNGPLEEYRKKAQFNWRRMKLIYDTLTTIKLKNKIWKFMEQNPLFQMSDTTLTLDETRHVTVKRMYTIYNEKFAPLEKIIEDPKTYIAESEALFMYDSSLAIKLSLTFRMFSNTILGLGGPQHYHFIEALDKAKIGGCFALTELSHGSNAKGMRTTATYCPKKRQFVLNCGDFEAAKFWVGCLGKCATHAIVYAMLISNGKNHGLHSFVVPIRDPKTLKPYPGVIVGDIGEKISLNGLDNGFVLFKNYHIPKENALDKLGGVDDAGEYRTPLSDPGKRFGASLGILSGGRVFITSIATTYLQKAIVIAIRYSAVRRQFGPDGAAQETPVLQYQQQQVRLLPYLATTFAYRIFCTWFVETHARMSVNSMLGQLKNGPELGMELHALSSAAKPVCGWGARDGIQNCREACGGQGYLKAAAIGDLRNENDANCTYEGENSLLLQQSSNWLLGLWAQRHQLKPEDTPLGSLNFLQNADKYLKQTCPWKTVEDFMEPSNIIEIYKWLTAYTIKTTSEKVAELKNLGMDNLDAKNESQAYYASALSVVYAQNFILNHFYESSVAFEDAACGRVLMRLVCLYGAFMLETHLATLYMGGYLSGRQGQLVREVVLRQCAALVPDAVALADTLAPPDFCMRSVLGASDGQVYKHIEGVIMSTPGAMARPSWWADVVHWQTYVTSKL